MVGEVCWAVLSAVCLDAEAHELFAYNSVLSRFKCTVDWPHHSPRTHMHTHSHAHTHTHPHTPTHTHSLTTLCCFMLCCLLLVLLIRMALMGVLCSSSASS